MCWACQKLLQEYYIFIQEVRNTAHHLVETVERNEQIGNGLETIISLKEHKTSPKSCTSFRPILPKLFSEIPKNKCLSPPSVPFSRFYKCLECGEAFKSHKNLREHESEQCIRNISGVFVCKFCHLCFKDDNKLSNHQKLHHSEQKCVCHLCKKVFNSKGYLSRHINKIHQHTFLPFFCGECNDTMSSFSSQDEIQKHFDNVEHISETTKDNVPAEVNGNPESINDEDMDLEMHEEFLDEFLLAHTNENSFQFSECWDALDLHFNEMYGNTSFQNNEEHCEAFPCPKCFLQFSKPQPLLKHLAELHNVAVLICRNCGQASPSLKDFKLHQSNKCVAKDDANVKISCPYNCNKTFTSTLNLKQHLRIVHTQNRKDICQLCDKQFSTLDHLKKHVLSQHQNERKHICHICSKSFTQMCHLNQHMTIHTSGKPFKCTECLEKFWRRIDMERHRKKHHLGS